MLTQDLRRRSAPPTRRDQIVGAIGTITIGLIAIVLPLVIARHFGAFGIPRSDDWSYLVTMFRVVDSGRLSFNHWVSMTLVGQLALAAPVATLARRDIGALQLFTVLLGAGGLASVAFTMPRHAVRRGAAWLLAATIASGPLWGPLAVSFMTDIPTFAFSALGMLLACRALSRRPISMAMLIASFVAAFVAFTIRQYAIVGIVAAAATGIWWYLTHWSRRSAVRLTLIATGLLATATALLAWWSGIPDGHALTPAVPTLHSLGVAVLKLAGFVRLAGLLLIPVLVYVGPGRILARSWRRHRDLTTIVLVPATLALIATALRVPNDAFVGNYFMPDGALSDIVIIGARPDVLPGPAWSILVGLGTAAGLVLVAAAIPALATAGGRLRSRNFSLEEPVTIYLTLTVIGYLVAFTLAIATGLQAYDRYILPVLPAMGFLLLGLDRRPENPPIDAPASDPSHDRPVGRRRLAATGASLALLASLGLAYTIDSASFDGARWRVAEAATARGWSARQVNGGFEWLNYHRGDKIERGAGAAACVTVHVNPSRPPREVVAVVRSSAPTRPDALLVAFRTPAPCRKARR